MAIAHDATGTFGATQDTASPMEWTHTPVGTPRGIIVLVAAAAGTDTVTGVTYGGTAMARVVATNKSSGEVMSSYIYFLGASVPTGAQTVSVTFTGSLGHMGASVSVTASDDTSIDSFSSISSDSAANPSITLSTTVDTITYGVTGSGAGTVGGMAPDANHTDIQEVDHGASCSSTIRRSAVVASGSPAVGWTIIADDYAACACAVREGGVASSVTGPLVGFKHLGFGGALVAGRLIGD